MQILEVMVTEGWVKAASDPSKPRFDIKSKTWSGNFRTNEDDLTHRMEPSDEQAG